MTSAFTIDRVFKDRRLLGAALGDFDLSTWRPALKAAFGLKLNDAEAKTFAQIAGNRAVPETRVRELWAVIGRRGGKSRMAAAVATYLALFVKHRRSHGERPMVLVIASSVDQARTVFGYVKGFLDASEVLSKEVVDAKAFEVTLSNGVVIAVHSSSFRTVRGRTLIACIMDECSFWRDEASANPDVETYRAVLPSLATTNGMLIGISTPYRKIGLLYQKYRDHFGIDGNDVLVLQGPTTAFNSTLAPEVIAAHRAADPTAATAEWDAQFRDDLSSFLDDASIDAAVEHGRPAELPPREGCIYFAFTDMSGGGHDASTLCILHRDGERLVADVIRGRRGHHDPAIVAAEYAALAKEYRCRAITGDNYAKEWVAGAYRSAGLEYRRSPLVRSDLYLEGQVSFARGLVSVPDHAQLLRELRLLERRTARSGKDSVDHGVGGSDDHANALFGAMYVAAKAAARPRTKIVSPLFYSNRLGWIGDGQANTPPPPGYRRTHEPWRDFVGPDAIYSHWPGSGPREW
jgi:hypothetical protein